MATGAMLLVEELPRSEAGAMDMLPFLALASVIWYIESSSRGRRLIGGQPQSSFVPSCSKLVKEYAPETAGLLLCCSLVIALRARGDRTVVDPSDQAAWEEIQSQWPILTTADSLFAIQAMLRVLLLLSAILRSSGCGTLDALPLEGSPAIFYLLAGLLRVLLLAISPAHGLEGPLSGPIYLAFEVAALPLLFKLAVGVSTLPVRPLHALGKLAAWMLGVTFSAVLASQHRLPLADDAALNGLFTMVSLLELAAAVALLCTVVTCGGGVRGSFASFAHVLLPIQQFLSMYFFLTAFDISLERASVGSPLTLLQLSGAAELVLLLLAGVAHLALAGEVESDEVSEGRVSSVLF